MRSLFLVACVSTLLFTFCKTPASVQTVKNEPGIAALFDRYYHERMKLLPIEATQNGDTLHNDQLYADFTDSYRAVMTDFYARHLAAINGFKRESLNEQEQISYDVFKREMELSLQGLALGFLGNNVTAPDHRVLPFNQFYGIPIYMGQLGSGEGAQPFKTLKDYENWIKRATAFSAWADSAIIYFRKGIASGIVLPQVLVKKMIPQMEAMVVTDPAKSIFYGPITKFPANFPPHEKERLTKAYTQLIKEQLVPSYQRLANFLRTEYLPKARLSTGINALAEGSQYYNWLIRYWTTTTKTPDAIYETGLAEVKRIRGLMDSVKRAVNYQGDLSSFFQYMRTDKQFMPFKTPEEILNSYRSVQARIEPNLKKMFGNVPKTPFEIRQTEAFRAASASAEYFPGAPDGSRPGIFYVPILDATKYNVTSGMEGLFLHEAIPGHHYQASLQNENKKLPKFQRFAFYGAYVEGWGLYAESLGKELGVYTDPYQYIGALVKEMHRSVRLVVDAGMHTKNWTREQAIQYMMENLPFDEQRATAEIERYMALPAQALSYKIGSLKIQELRKKYEQQLGNRFILAAFHDELLNEGSLPLETLERKMDVWASRQAK